MWVAVVDRSASARLQTRGLTILSIGGVKTWHRISVLRLYWPAPNKKNDPDRLEMSKYCRFCKKHTVHKEAK